MDSERFAKIGTQALSQIRSAIIVEADDSVYLIRLELGKLPCHIDISTAITGPSESIVLRPKSNCLAGMIPSRRYVERADPDCGLLFVRLFAPTQHGRMVLRPVF